jgi:hypothetical protein
MIMDPIPSAQPSNPNSQLGNGDASMSEEGEDLDLGELDLLGLEEACRKKDHQSIPTNQVHLLKEALMKARADQKLGVLLSIHKEAKKGHKD